MSTHDIIVIGASSGGLDALRTLVAKLPAELPAAVLVVLHLSPEHPSVLPSILSRVGKLPATHPFEGEEIQAGRIYVAPPDRHLLLDGRQIRLTRGPKENYARPSIDVLFRSAALHFGPRVIGVVLSGALDDGTSGLYAIKQRGGLTVVQDPEDALYSDMPRNALRAVQADYVLPVIAMGDVLAHLVNETRDEQGESPMLDHSEHQPLSPPVQDSPAAASASPASELASSTGAETPSSDLQRLEAEVEIAQSAIGFEEGVLQLGEPTLYTCPECHGTLLGIKEGNRTRFRCHTGHAFSLNILLAEVTKSVEKSLWSAVRVIEESELLMNHLSQHLQEANDEAAAALLLVKAQQARERAQLVRQVIVGNEVLSQDQLDSQLAGENPDSSTL